MNLAPLGRRISFEHLGRVKEISDGVLSTVDALTADGSKTIKRFRRQIKKNVKKNRLLKQAVFLLLMAPLVVPVGVVMAGYGSTPAVAPVDIVTDTPATFTLGQTVVVPTPTLSIEVQESAYQAAQRAKAAEQLRLARARATALRVTFTATSTELMTLAGIPRDQWVYVDFIINHEAGWNGTLTYNRQGSGAYGICQALPGHKMASAGADWRTNTLTQLKWCNSYALGRYGSWENAYQFWLKKRWW